MQEHEEKSEARFFTCIEAEENSDVVIFHQPLPSALSAGVDISIIQIYFSLTATCILYVRYKLRYKK